MKLLNQSSIKEYKLKEIPEVPSHHRLPARSLFANVVLLVCGGGLLIWSLQFIKTRMTSVLSVDAVVNAAIIDIKAPDGGTVAAVAQHTGDAIVAGQPLFVLKNERVSQLPAQELQGKLHQQRALLQQAQDRLAGQTGLMATLVEDEQKQGQLEVSAAQRAIAQSTSELAGAQARYRLAQKNYTRSKSLQAQGAISQANVDTAAIELEQRQSEVASLEAHISNLQVSQEAAEQGLSLAKTRSNYDPRIRRQELQLQMQEQQRLTETLAQAVQDAEAAQVQGQKDVQMKQQTVIKAPTGGMLWQLSVEPGRVVQAGEFMGKIVDCERRWVDAVVEEAAVRSIAIGDTATVDLYGRQGAVALQGKVSQIRSGLGRLTPGQDITGSVDLNLPRYAQIRVDLDTAAQDQASKDPTQKNFCYVGYTGKVTLQVKSALGHSSPFATLTSWLRW